MPLPLLRSHGREGWAPASYLKKADVQSPKLSAGAAVHASTNDLDGASRHNQQNNAVKENRDNSHKENRLSFLSENKRKFTSYSVAFANIYTTCIRMFTFLMRLSSRSGIKT